MGAVSLPERATTGGVGGLLLGGSGLLVGMTAALALAVLGALAGQGAGGGASGSALADIPVRYLALYRAAGDQQGLGADGWSVLAAIGSIETDHGRSTEPGVSAGVNGAGCCAGPMQFNVRNGPPSTWARYGVDGNGDGRRDAYDPADAIPAAARYLRASGAPADWRRAILAYNHADWYVADVLERAAAYRTALPSFGDAVAGSSDPAVVLANPAIALTAVQRADLRAGAIDPRVVAILDWIGRGHRILVTALRGDHRPVGNHAAGRALDIGAVDGEPCTGTRAGACGQLAVALARVGGVLHATELIYCFDPDGPASPDAFARSDHCDHVHWGLDR